VEIRVVVTRVGDIEETPAAAMAVDVRRLAAEDTLLRVTAAVAIRHRAAAATLLRVVVVEAVTRLRATLQVAGTADRIAADNNLMYAYSGGGPNRRPFLLAVVLLLSEMESESDGDANRRAGRRVNAWFSLQWFILQARHEKVLRLPVVFVVQVVDCEIEIDSVVDPFGHAEVDHIQAGRERRLRGLSVDFHMLIHDVVAGVAIAQ
jgi:hypothetical protein